MIMIFKLFVKDDGLTNLIFCPLSVNGCWQNVFFAYKHRDWHLRTDFWQIYYWWSISKVWAIVSNILLSVTIVKLFKDVRGYDFSIMKNFFDRCWALFSLVDDSAVVFIIKVIVWDVLNWNLVAKIFEHNTEVLRNGIPTWTKELLYIQKVQEVSHEWNLISQGM